MSGLKGNQKKGNDGKFVANPVTKPLRSLKDISSVPGSKDDWAASYGERAEANLKWGVDDAPTAADVAADMIAGCCDQCEDYYYNDEATCKNSDCHFCPECCFHENEGEDYARRVRELENQLDISTSDAQGMVDAEDMLADRKVARDLAVKTLREAAYREFPEDDEDGNWYIACRYDLGQGGPNHYQGGDGITEWESNPQLCREIAFEGILTDDVTDVTVDFNKDGREFTVNYTDHKGYRCTAEYRIEPE